MNLPLGENLTSAKGGLSYSLTVGFYVIINLLISIIITAGGLTGDFSKYLLYLCSPVAIAAAVAVTLRVGKLKPSRVFSFRCSPKYYLIAILLIFGLIFSLGTVNGYFIELLKLAGYTPRQSTLPTLSGGGIVGALIVIAVLPAVFEEVLFRGVLLKNAEEDAGSVGAILLCGLTFSLYHGSVEQTIYQFICGCLFALLAVRSGSVLPTVFIHFINNALIIICSVCGALDEAGNLIMSQAANVAITACSAVALVVATVWLILDKMPLKHKKQGGVVTFFAWASLGLLIMAIIWITGLFGL
ncbi:MAG: lysostaphin resistance A-like protein [Candidatus Coproplasma sp.]